MKYILDALKMQTRKEAHAYLKEMLNLPEYYGGNLDALYDCLTEMETMEVGIKNVNADNKYVSLCIKVMREAGVEVDVI